MAGDINHEISDIWMQSMRSGRYEAAWEHCDRMLKLRAGKPCWHLPRHLQYVWNGTPLHDKRVLVRCYHGLGDTIQFIRYIPCVKAIAAEVIVWAQPKLLRLLQTVQGIDQLLPLHDGAPGVKFDVDVEIMELPYIFRSTVDTIPGGIPYLHIDPTSFLAGRDHFAVGLVWRAGDWDERRSIPFSFFYPLAAIKEIRIYILQPGAAEAGWSNEFGIFPGELEMYEYAQVICGLDLLISIDSMPAHLAGALGVPVWTLLQADADWRWMDNGKDTPWYPSMRLFRQDDPGEWEPVISRIAGELEKLSKNNIQLDLINR